MRASLRSSLGRRADERNHNIATPDVARQRLAWVRTAGAPVAGIVCVTLVLHVVWLARFRHGYVTEWDESGYMQFSLSNFDALHDQGLWTFAKTVGGRETFGPLLPLVASLAYPIVGRGVFGGLLVVPLFFRGASRRGVRPRSPVRLRFLGGGGRACCGGNAGGYRLRATLSLCSSGNGVPDSRVMGSRAIRRTPARRLGCRFRGVRGAHIAREDNDGRVPAGLGPRRGNAVPGGGSGPPRQDTQPRNRRSRGRLVAGPWSPPTPAVSTTRSWALDTARVRCRSGAIIQSPRGVTGRRSFASTSPTCGFRLRALFSSASVSRWPIR
jgi:hypothetical protein